MLKNRALTPGPFPWKGEGDLRGLFREVLSPSPPFQSGKGGQIGRFAGVRSRHPLQRFPEWKGGTDREIHGGAITASLRPFPEWEGGTDRKNSRTCRPRRSGYREKIFVVSVGARVL